MEWLLKGTPRAVQEEALRRSWYCEGGPQRKWAHFMEMRLGKTPLALNEFALARLYHGVDKMIVQCPVTYKGAWEKAIIEWGLELPIHIFESSDRDAARDFMRSNREGVLIIHFEALIQDKTIKVLDEWDDFFYVIDESVRIKSPTSSTFKRSYKIAQRASFVRLLTGMPNPQGPHDLWSQLATVDGTPEGLNYHKFKHTFCNLGGFKGKKVVGVKNADNLNRLKSRCSFTADRATWLVDHKETDYSIVDIPMSKAQQAAYDAMERDFVLWVEETGDMITAQQVITKRMKMQQIASGFIYNEDREPVLIEHFVNTSKWRALADTLDEVSGKVLVVAHYGRTMDALIENLPNCAVIAGRARMKELGRDIESEKALFNTGDRCNVMVAQLDAVKYGHTLMGNPDKPCLDMVFYENSYNLDTRKQAENRPQGEGQLGPLHVRDFVSSGVERDIIEALQRKTNVFEATMRNYH